MIDWSNEMGLITMASEILKLYEGFDSYLSIGNILNAAGAKKALVVCEDILDLFAVPLRVYLESLPVELIYFHAFTPNPDYPEVLAGVRLFLLERCDFIISIGGGSAIDVAKCINVHGLCGEAPAVGELVMLSDVRCEHLAVPTTAGSGSESTCFAVVYRDGEKQSVEHRNLSPDYVILDPSFLKTLPPYQKKSTLLDALCQAIESNWAKGSTAESKGYADEAIELIYENVHSYVEGERDSMKGIMYAAHLAGKAINISKTTAAHAMSYKLSSMFGIAHGHAVALCMPHVWRHYIDNCGFVGDERNRQEAMLRDFVQLVAKLDMRHELEYGDDAVAELVASVNMQRLENHPVVISQDEMTGMYKGV